MANILLIKRDGREATKSTPLSTFTTKQGLWDFMLPKFTDSWDIRTTANNRVYKLTYQSMCAIFKKYPNVCFRDEGLTRYAAFELPKNLKHGEE